MIYGPSVLWKRAKAIWSSLGEFFFLSDNLIGVLMYSRNHTAKPRDSQESRFEDYSEQVQVIHYINIFEFESIDRCTKMARMPANNIGTT